MRGQEANRGVASVRQATIVPPNKTNTFAALSLHFVLLISLLQLLSILKCDSFMFLIILVNIIKE